MTTENKLQVTLHFRNAASPSLTVEIENERQIFVGDHYVTITTVTNLGGHNEAVVQNTFPWSAIEYMHKQWVRTKPAFEQPRIRK